MRRSCRLRSRASIGANSDALLYGGGDLRRVDLTTLAVSTANLLSAVQMLEVTAMAFTTANRVRLDGTDSSGQPTIVLVDTITGAVTTTAADVPTFSTIEAVE